jgi:hypothetical protein
MKYYLDQEFIEGFHKPLLGKRRHFIDLISIGIVCEDGREYYAISNEFDPKDADEWVMGNVIAKLPSKENYDWKSNKQIADEIIEFVYKGCECSNNVADCGKNIPIEFYGYYSDYDWVLFCSLFGRMIDLPQGFPMFCIDLKQSLDEAIDKLGWDLEGVKKYKGGFPEQENEHNALADARWNKKLHEYIQTL